MQRSRQGNIKLHREKLVPNFACSPLEPTGFQPETVTTAAPNQTPQTKKGQNYTELSCVTFLHFSLNRHLHVKSNTYVLASTYINSYSRRNLNLEVQASKKS